MASVYKHICLFAFLGIYSVGFTQVSYLDSCFKEFDTHGILLSSRKQGKHSFTDNTLFFSLVTLHGIESYESDLTEEQKQIFVSLKSRILDTIQVYTNITGRPTINFWQTQPNNQWPGHRWAKIKQRHIPDDFDDNVYWRMLAPNAYADSVLCQLLEDKKNGNEYWAKNLPDSLKRMQVYNTWIGKSMPKEIDLVVLSNILLYKIQNQIPFSSTDYLSLDYIAKTYKQARKLKHGKVLSPQYARYSTILYHIARLKKAYPQWNLEKEELKKELYWLWNQDIENIEAVMLCSSLLKLELEAPPLDNKYLQRTESTYAFFYANAGSVFPKPLNRTIASFDAYFMPYTCVGLEYYLLWEYQILSTKKGL